MAGGGIWRTDQVQLAFSEELVDGTIPAAIDQSFGAIKGGVVLPDVEYSWDYFYGVGRDGRSRKDVHEGNQAFRGSIPQIYVTHNETRRLLEMVVGEFSEDVSASGTATAVDDTSLTDSGETWTGFKDGNFAIFSGITVGYISSGGAADVVNVFPTINRSGTAGWNGPRPAVGDTVEIRKVESVLDVFGAGDKFAVHTQNLSTMSWAVRLRNAARHGAASVGSNLTANYLGGKVNRATLSARLGEKLMLAYDEVLFRDLVHDVSLPSTSVDKFSASVLAPTATYPFDDVLVFSQGTISLFELGNTFARINSFSLSIDNQVTEQRYISKVTVAGGTSISQIPFELIEGNRLITLEIEAVLETREWWEHLMRQGRNDALSAKTGFDFQLTFDNTVSGESFNIQGPAAGSLTFVAGVDGSSALASASNIGCVIEAAPHSVPGPDQSLITIPLRINVPSIVLRWVDV